MKFSTQVHIPPAAFEIDYQDQMLTLGSCFAENIGMKFQQAFFLTQINPFGVLYNPLSVGQSIRCLLSDKEFTEDDLFQSSSLWNSFAHSSAYSAATKDEALQKINSALLAARYFLTETNVMLITFGTAWIYERADNGRVVANCHKMPANFFYRRRLRVEEIVEEMTDVLRLLRERFPKIELIFTVSPIRHWKDGAHENTVSKSTLHLAVDELVQNHSYAHYFPAFEIVMDELRDYRFYASDMLHPSDTAVNYIWHRFSETFLSKETLVLKKELEQLRADLNHRPLHQETSEFNAFLEYVEKKKDGLINKHPFLKNRF